MSEKENTSHDNAIGWAIMGVAIGACCYGFWYYFGPELRDAVRWIRYGEMWIARGVVEIMNMLGLYDGDYTVHFNGKDVSWKQGFKDTPRFQKDDLGYYHLSYFTALSMQPLRYPIIAFLVVCGLWAYTKGPKTYYRHKLDLEGLIKRQSINFPVIAPFTAFNPAKQPPRPPGSPVPAELPDFAEALGPEEWIAYNQIPVPDGKLDKDATQKAFLKQLGGRWKGPMTMEPYKQILLASFCLKAARKRNDADIMLGRLALCWDAKKGLDLKRDKKLHKDAMAVLKNKKLAESALSKANKHAFETTALLRALATAREEGGVLAPAQFVWLRAHNRNLWYPLNNLGRQSFHIEALGAMGHYKAEKMTDRPIPIPKLEGCIQTMEEYTSSKKARPIPALDYSNSTKRGVKKAV